MALDLGLSALIDAGGGLLFVLVGVGIVVLGHGSRRAFLTGGFSVAFGLGSASENVFIVGEGDVAPAWSVIVLYGSATVLGLLLAKEIAAPLPARSKLAIALVCAVATIAGLAILLDESGAVTAFGATPALAAGVVFVIISMRVAILAFVLAAALRLRALPPEATRERRAIGLLALAFGMWLVFNAAVNVGGFVAFGPFGSAGGLLFSVATAASVLAFLPLPRSHEPRLLRAYTLLLLGSGAVGVVLDMLFVAPSDETGANGIFRTVGVALLALAIIRYDLLGVPLPRIVVRRGAIATGALATLFIVAQLAQNFLSASYGLLTGGIVAGAFLFAAQPLQRAMESLISPRPAEPASRRVPVQDAGAEVLYRETLRMAMRDGRVTSEEEQHLAELGERLGISARRAVALRHEVEREKGVR